MFGFEPRIAGVVSNRSTNWATTTALAKKFKLGSPVMESADSDAVMVDTLFKSNVVAGIFFSLNLIPIMQAAHNRWLKANKSEQSFWNYSVCSVA